MAPPTFTTTPARKRPVPEGILIPALRLDQLGVHLLPTPGLRISPAPPPGLGTEFGQFMVHFRWLEQWMDKGWSFKDRISAFRKIWYNNDRFDQVIKGAKGVQFPPAWKGQPENSPAFNYLQDANHQEVTISGKKTDIGHLFAGTDAFNHFEPRLDFRQHGVQLSSLLQVTNVELANFIGDLGSTVEAYLAEDFRVLFQGQLSSVVNEADLRVFYDGDKGKTSPDDLAGDADAFVLPWNDQESLADNMESYYHALAKGKLKRFTSFANLIKLGQLRADNTFDNEAAQKPTLKVKIAAAARALGAKRIFVPTPGNKPPRFDLIQPATDLVIPMFLKSVRDEVIKEK